MHAPLKARDPPSQDDTRQHCRHCRGLLAVPAQNPRNRFCGETCERGFYRTHCRICERQFTGTRNARRQLCGRRECATIFRCRRDRFFSRFWCPRYPSSPAASNRPKSLAKSTADSGVTIGRAVVIAGPPGRAGECVPLGEYDGEIFRQSWRVNAKFWNDVALIGSRDPPVNLLGGYKFPGALNLLHPPRRPGTATSTPPSPAAVAEPSTDADLPIPDFLRRCA
jgi:hypothetical protein